MDWDKRSLSERLRERLDSCTITGCVIQYRSGGNKCNYCGEKKEFYRNGFAGFICCGEHYPDCKKLLNRDGDVLIGGLKVPIPTPEDDETKSEFMSRCLCDTEMVAGFSEPDRRFAVCNAEWERQGRKKR